MFCPKCSMPMDRRDATWFCTSGQLEFSKHLGDALAEAFESSYRPDPVPRKMQLGRWYCPGCGVPLDANARCEDCGKELRKFMFHLVELDPHGDGSGGWR